MLHKFHIYVATVCSKIFHCFSLFVAASVLMSQLQVFYQDIAYVFHVYCNYIFHMFHLFLRHMLHSSVSYCTKSQGLQRMGCGERVDVATTYWRLASGDTVGPKCPCGGDMNEWGMGGGGAGRVRHARGIVMEAGPACNVLGTKGLREGGL